MSTILPIVTRDLGDIELYGWVFSAFFLGSLIGITVVGGLIDRVGLLRPFVLGLTLFGIGLLIGGLAPSMPVLILGRFIQGMGGGAIPPTAYVAIGRSLPESMRARMFATLATAWVVPGIVGPALSATVAENIGWRLVFIGLIPVVVLAGVMTVPALRRVPAAIPAGADAASAGAGLSGRRIRLALVITLGAGLVLAGLTAEFDRRAGAVRDRRAACSPCRHSRAWRRPARSDWRAASPRRSCFGACSRSPSSRPMPTCRWRSRAGAG